MELMLTGDAISGEEAVRVGYANRAFAPDALEKEVLAIAMLRRLPREGQRLESSVLRKDRRSRSLRAWPTTPVPGRATECSTS